MIPSSPGVWVVFHKAHTGVQSIDYEDLVCEALCFGWVDSLIKRLDENRFARKVTPRRSSSKWSDSNRKRWASLKEAGLLAPAGSSAAPTARTYSPRPVVPELPDVHCEGATGERQGVEILQRPGALQPPRLRRMDSRCQAHRDTGAAHCRIGCVAGGREEAGIEVVERLLRYYATLVVASR